MAQWWLGGRYRLVRMLGSGGTAWVWRAFDERMQREVALKILKEAYGLSAAADRFAREALIAGQLASPNIVVVFDKGEERLEARGEPSLSDAVAPYGPPTRPLPGFGEPPETVDPYSTSPISALPRLDGHGGTVMYVAMELVEGRSLAQIVADGSRLPIDLVVGWTLLVCDALDVAHGRGVLHRDIKPANIMVTPRGVVKVLDFGIARFMESLPSRAGLTLPGSMLGTPAYMSPEQIQGGDVDVRSDLYAVGCLLYELLTGTPPFGFDDPQALLFRHVHLTPEPVRGRRDEVPAELAALVMDLLSKKPDGRPRSAREVWRRLRALPVLPPHDLTPPPWYPLPMEDTAGRPFPPDDDGPGRHVDTMDDGGASSPVPPSGPPPRVVPPAVPDAHPASGVPGTGPDSVELLRVRLLEQISTLGSDAPETLDTREELAVRLGRDGDPALAVRLLRAVISDCGRLRGALNPDTLRARRGLAHWTAKAGDPGEAARLLAGLLPDQVAVHGTDHRVTLQVRRDLAGFTGRSGNHEGAVRLLRALVPDAIRVFGPDSHRVIEVLDDLTDWEHRLDLSRLREGL